MGSSASKEYEGPKNPETDNLVFIIEEFTDYTSINIRDYDFNIYNILLIAIFIFFFILSLLELISNILLYNPLLYRTRKRTYK